jgi:hypothetical protein
MTKTLNPRRRSQLSRRLFLGAAGAAVLSPFLPLRDACADASHPLRLILLYTPDGYRSAESWAPAAASPLQLGPVHEPLQPFASDILLLGGLRQVRDPAKPQHSAGMSGLFTARSAQDNGASESATDWATGPSIDQIIAQALPEATTYPSLEMAVRPGNKAMTFNRPIYAGAGAPMTPESDPHALYNRLFAEMGLELAELERIRTERRSVLDLVRSDLERVSAYYAGAEAQKLEAHLDGIRQIEKQLDGTVSCAVPAPTSGIDLEDDANLPQLSRLQIDLLVSALACGLTRVSSLAFGGSGSFSSIIMKFLGLSQIHHKYAHDESEEAAAAIHAIDTWYSEQVAYLLEKLAAVPEGNGSLLDNTLVVWAREMASGGHAAHSNAWIVAGGKNCGSIQHGRYIGYGDEPHSSALVTIGRLFGLDIDGIGDIDPGRPLDWG